MDFQSAFFKENVSRDLLLFFVDYITGHYLYALMLDVFNLAQFILYRDGLYTYRSPLCMYRIVQKYRMYVRYVQYVQYNTYKTYYMYNVTSSFFIKSL